MFQTAPSNLDISSVSVTSDATTLYISVTTVSFETWTKYMIFMKTGAGSSTTSNAWSRPVDFSGQTINHFIGSWVDQPTDNSQCVSWDGANWDWGGSTTFANSVSGNTVTWAVSLASLGLGQGDKLLFDVATSGGGGGDSGIDHLSRADPATGWWSDTSYSGQFLSYTVPGPGALALLGLAGMVGRRRRQA
jgi:MYXO-CTERM domain-containing protein